MKVGLYAAGTHPAVLAKRGAALAERLELDSLWIADHMLGVFHPTLWPEMSIGAAGGDPDACLDPWLLLATLAEGASMPLGMGVTDTTRRTPADVARTALTMQQLAPAGFVLGVGAGEAENLLPFGLPFDRPVARTESFLAELRHLLDTGTMPAGHGRTGLPLASAAGPPRLWVAGHGPRMLRLTGTYADGWFPAWAMTPDDYAARRDVVAAAADAAGRPHPESALYLVVVLAASRDAAAAMFDAEPLAKLFALLADAETWRRHGLEHPSGPGCRGLVDLVVHDLDPDALRALAPRIPFELVEEVAFIGSPDELTAAIGPYAEAGAEHVVLANMTGLVGGGPELKARADDLGRLRQLLRGC